MYADEEGVLEANGIFSSLIKEGFRLRERSGSCRTRTRSLPGWVRPRHTVRRIDSPNPSK